jgi:hypothetical protein
LQSEQALVDHCADVFELRALIALHVVRGSEKAGELLRYRMAEGFGALLRLTGEALDVQGEFFAQAAILVALPLLGAGQIIAQTGFERIGRACAEQQNQIQYDEKREDDEEDGGKHFGDFLF